MDLNKKVCGNVQVKIKKLEAKLKGVSTIVKKHKMLHETTWRNYYDGNVQRMII